MTKDKTAQELALKPCPFCGSNPTIINHVDSVEVYCEECDIPSVICELQSDAYKDWNTRALTPPSDDAVSEALEVIGNDPIENTVGKVLPKNTIQDGEKGKHGETKHLDFYLPDEDVYIECCAYHAPRKIEQLSRVDNCILVQGQKAANYFSKALQSRAGQEGESCPFTMNEMQECLDCIILDDKEEEICSCIKEPCKWLLEQYLQTKPHPSRADAVDVGIPSLHSKIDMDCEDEYGREITIEESIAIGTAMKLLSKQGYLTQKPDDGMVLVPREPTDAMIFDGEELMEKMIEENKECSASDVYKAMIREFVKNEN